MNDLAQYFHAQACNSAWAIVPIAFSKPPRRWQPSGFP